MEYPVDEHTVSYWPLDDAQNPIANTIQMAQAFASTGLTDDFISNDNGSTTTFSRARAIQIGKPATLMFERTQPFTISAWIFPIDSEHVIYSNLNNDFATPINEKGIEFGINAGNLILRLVGVGGNAGSITARQCTAASGGGLIQNGTESHVVVTYDGSSLRSGIAFYVNNTLRATNAGSPNFNNLNTSIIPTNDIHIGKNGTSSGSTVRYANSSIREVSVWNKALSAGEVSQVFNAGTPPNLLSLSFVANLLAWWKIQTSDNFLVANGILDSASVGPFHGTAVGSARGIGWLHAATSMASSFFCRIAGGPRQAMDLGVDYCRWFNKTNDLGTGGVQSDMSTGVAPQSSIGGLYLPSVNKCLFGTAWTIEGWLYVDRAPAVTGVFETAATAMTVFNCADFNLMTVQISTANKLQVTWLSGSTRTSTSTLTIPIQQWFHFAAIGTAGVTNRDVQFYINGIDAGLVTGNPKVATADVSTSLKLGLPAAGATDQPGQYWGGVAYFRLSNKARSLAEVQAAATDPLNIIVDANTVAYWGFQEASNLIDMSPNGNHLVSRTLMDEVDPAAPNDSYGAQGTTPERPSHLFSNSSSPTAMDSPTKQSGANMLCGQNEYTIECFFNPEYNLSSNRDLYFAGGVPGHTTGCDNTVLEWTFLTNRKIQILLETEQRLVQSDDTTSVITLAENLKTRFNSHRTNQPKNFHGTIDQTNTTTSQNSGPPAALLTELKADYNAHIASTTFHGVADVTNTITSVISGGSNLAACIACANEMQTKFNLHGINSGGNYHSIQDTEIVTTANGSDNATYIWFTRSNQALFAITGNQTKELAAWYGLAIRKRAVGNLNYWKLGELAASTHAISMGNAAPFSFERNTPFTIIIWVNSLPTAVGTPRVQHIIGKSDSTANPTGYSLFFATDGKLTFRMGNGSAGVGNVVQVASNNTAPAQLTGFETCFAVTYDGSGSAASGSGASGVKLFANGSRLTNGTPTTTPINSGSAVTTAPFTIGLRNLTDQPLGGYIREASVWDRELTAAEISEAFGSSGRPPPNLLTTSMASDLIGYWKFDQADNALTVLDHSSSAVNGTPQGGLTPTPKSSSFWDLYLNGQPFETIGPMPDPTVGNIFKAGRDVAQNSQYFLSPKNSFGSSVRERRSNMRLSDVARSDADILEYYNFFTRTASTNYKMRATDDAAVTPPGYVYWVAPFPDFDATLIGTASPPLVGNIIPGSIIQLTQWDT